MGGKIDSPVGDIPHAHTRVERAGGYSLSIKRYCIYLRKVTLQGSQTSAFANAPYAGGGIVATRDDKIAMDFQASYASLVSDENVFTQALFDIPDTKGGVPGTRYRRGSIGHFEAANCRGMAAEHVDAFAGRLLAVCR